MVAVLDEPVPSKDSHGFATAGWTAAPVVGGVIARIGPLLNIKPVDEESETVKKALEIEGQEYVHKGQKIAPH